jgi:hypothetical protein
MEEVGHRTHVLREGDPSRQPYGPDFCCELVAALAEE